MINNNKVDDQLICLKTGSKAQIIDYFDKNKVRYAKIKIDVEFGNTSVQILRSLQLNEIDNYFSLSKS
jgi:hypothetical protein|tara:strand:- start:47 stop:250 length:204 start_codon:yes stop_codon:yes gene_type:complete